MKKLKRLVEMFYLTEEGNTKTWDTIYVEIPRDTPEDKIPEYAELFMTPTMGGKQYILSGVYSIPTLDDSDETMEYVVITAEEGEEFQQYASVTGLQVPTHTEVGIELVNEQGENELILFPGIYFKNN